MFIENLVYKTPGCVNNVAKIPCFDCDALGTLFLFDTIVKSHEIFSAQIKFDYCIAWSFIFD